MIRQPIRAALICTAVLFAASCTKESSAPPQANQPEAKAPTLESPAQMEDKPSVDTGAQQKASDIPAADKVDNTAEVEAVAKQANPTQAEIDQYNKDEAEMADKSARDAKKKQ